MCSCLERKTGAKNVGSSTKHTLKLFCKSGQLYEIDPYLVQVLFDPYPVQWGQTGWQITGWIQPLDDLLPKSEQENFLKMPMSFVTQHGNVWAAPLQTDVGLLFYLTRAIAAIPESWDELKTMATDAMKKQQIPWGYYWQGEYNPELSKGEGLMCNIVEVFSGFDAHIFQDPLNPKAKDVIVDSQQAHIALESMVNWIGSISPPQVLTSSEPEANGYWYSNQVAFLRSWPNIIYVSNDTSQSQVSGGFNVSALPGSQSCLGGWQLAINKNSRNKTAASDFIHWMLQEEVQQFLAVKEGFIVTRKSIYDDPYVKSWNPLFSTIRAIYDEPLRNGKPSPQIVFRPVSPKYPQIADAVENQIFLALNRKKVLQLHSVT